MVKRHERKWFVVYKVGDSEPTYLVSGYSEAGVMRALQLDTKRHKIVLAKVWNLVKIMGGYPYDLDSPNNLAPNFWRMLLDCHLYKVVILN